MDNLTPLTRLTPAEAYKRQVQADRRQAAIERRTAEGQAEVARLLDLYANGSLKRRSAEAAPVPEPTSYTVKRLPGGAALSGRKRSAASADEATEAKRAKRRERRAARKARQAAST